MFTHTHLRSSIFSDGSIALYDGRNQTYYVYYIFGLNIIPCDWFVAVIYSNTQIGPILIGCSFFSITFHYNFTWAITNNFTGQSIGQVWICFVWVRHFSLEQQQKKILSSFVIVEAIWMLICVQTRMQFIGKQMKRKIYKWMWYTTFKSAWISFSEWLSSEGAVVEILWVTWPWNCIIRCGKIIVNSNNNNNSIPERIHYSGEKKVLSTTQYEMNAQ